VAWAFQFILSSLLRGVFKSKLKTKIKIFFKKKKKKKKKKHAANIKDWNERRRQED